ncbi:MAG: SOS response-associated peptidase [Thermodesulfobacteriota bacterium]|nr:SOS response-associated peptidase [Thermodesulfobacteriota bacterium]
MEDRVSTSLPFLYNRLGPVTQGIVTAMCGRFTLYSSVSNLKKVFDIDTVTCEMEASYNIAPGNEIYAIIRGQDNRLGKLHWGLVPPWAKDLSGASGLINARAETLQEKPSFRKAFKERRCLIPADGFYEWREKQPWYCTPATGTLFGFAGLWETWKGKDQSVYHSCTIITTEASESVKGIHDRMPVIFKPEVIKEWLDPANKNYDNLNMILEQGRVTEVKTYPVAKLVDSPRNNDPRCIKPVSD